MFKRTTLLASIILTSACSTSPDKTDYVHDVVVQKTVHKNHLEIIGKEIVPIDLLELNLGLKVSLLSVIARLQKNQYSAQMSNSESADEVKSDVFLQIQYTRKKSEGGKFEQYDTALIKGVEMTLQSSQGSQSCDDNYCTVSQSFSFPIDSKLLQAAKIDGFKFKLIESTKNDKLSLETMIPGRYITALLHF